MLSSAFAAAVVAGIPDPTPVEPPGVGGITTIVNWVAWGAVIICTLGFLAGAAYLAIGAFMGHEMKGAKGVGLSIVGCVMVGAAGALLGTFI